MILNYIKLVWRHYRQNKFFLLINTLGSAVSIGSLLLISIYLYQELHVDKSNPNYRNVCRITTRDLGTDKHYASCSFQMAPILANESDDIAHFTRIVHNSRNFITIKLTERFYSENNFLLVDPSFFNIFNVKLSAGTREGFAETHSSVLLSEEMAVKYFGNTNPIGQTLTIRAMREIIDLNVIGVFKSPHNSVLQYDFLASTDLMPFFHKSDGVNTPSYWSRCMPYGQTYLLLNSQITMKEFKSIFPHLVESHYCKDCCNSTFSIQAMQDIYLNSSHLSGDIARHGNKTILYVLLIIGVLMLIISLFNSSLLFFAQYSSRNREIALQRIMGARKFDFFIYTLIEALMLSYLSMIFAVLFFFLLQPVMTNILDKDFFQILLLNWKFFALFIVFPTLIGLLVGCFVTFSFLKIDIMAVLRDNISGVFNKKTRWNAIIALQLMIFIGFTLFSIVVIKQTRFLQQAQTLGFEKEGVLSIAADANTAKVFKAAISKNSEILYASLAFCPPPAFHQAGVTSHFSYNENSINFCEINWIDYEYLPALGLQLAAGRNFSREFNDVKSVILNETAVNVLQISDPIGKMVRFSGGLQKVIGVVKDFHTQSFYHKTEPLGFWLNENSEFTNQIIIKYKTQNLSQFMAFLKQEWNAVSSNEFEYYFTDDELEKLYRVENKLRFIAVFASIAVLIITCAGLFMLAAFISKKLEKQVAIRKVLGATVDSILKMMMSRFFRLAVFANLVALPIVYYLSKLWLRHFTNTIQISAVYIVLPVFLSMVLTLLSVSSQTLKAAKTDPVVILKKE